MSSSRSARGEIVELHEPIVLENTVTSSIRPPLIVVEHMEELPTRWLLSEYEEAYEEAEKHGLQLIIAGVREESLQALLWRRGIPFTHRSSWELQCRPPVIVLDLRAEKRLEPWEASSSTCLIVGGIMGDYPPRGRGRLLLMRHPGAVARNLGPEQMSIHTAVWAASEVATGRRVTELRLAGPGRFSIRSLLGEIEVELPFAYPADEDGRPIVPGRVKKVLERGVLWDEL